MVAGGADIVGATLERIWLGVEGQPEVLSAVVEILDRVVCAWCEGVCAHTGGTRHALEMFERVCVRVFVWCTAVALVQPNCGQSR